MLVQEGVQEYTNQSQYLILSDLSVDNWDGFYWILFLKKESWRRELEIEVYEDKKGSCEFMYDFDEASVY